MRGCRFQGDAGAAQILLPSLLSSQHLKSRATTAIRLGQDQGTQGRSGQLRQGGLFRDIPERATSLLRWDACVTALSHVCFVTSSHGLRQQSWHAQSCHLAGLHHPPSCHMQEWHFQGQMSQQALALQGLFQTRQGTWGHPSPRGAGARADMGSALEGTKPGGASSSQGAGHPSVWRLLGLEPCPTPQYTVQPDPCSELLRAEPILMGAQEGRAVLGLGHRAGTCHPLPP